MAARPPRVKAGRANRRADGGFLRRRTAPRTRNGRARTWWSGPARSRSGSVPVRGRGHLRVTVAPAPSSCSLAFSAAALSTFSRTGLGAPSTRSLASLRPREVSARTSLMTAIFLSPAASRTTSNSSCSSAAAASPPPAAGARGGDRDGGGGGDPEGLLELLHELRELDQGHLLEGVKELVGAELGHDGVLSLLRYAVSGVYVVSRPGGQLASPPSATSVASAAGAASAGVSSAAASTGAAWAGPCVSTFARSASTVRAACESGAAKR